MGALPIHLDPALPLDVPMDVVKRLRRNGNAHKYRARKLNDALQAMNDNIEDVALHFPLIVIHDVDIIKCYERENWTCPRCFKRVDITKAGRHPDSPVCYHKLNFGHGGGHVEENIFPGHYLCNALEAAAIETPRAAKVTSLRKKHHGIDRKGKAVEPKQSKFRSQGGWTKGKTKWASRPMQSRNSFQRKIHD